MSTRKTSDLPATARVLRTWRRRRKLTQREIAASTGLTPARISAFERGEGAPSAAERERICAALEVKLRDFDAEVAWAEGEEKREIPGQAPLGKLTLQELAAAWDDLKPLVLNFFESVLRKEKAATGWEGRNP